MGNIYFKALFYLPRPSSVQIMQDYENPGLRRDRLNWISYWMFPPFTYMFFSNDPWSLIQPKSGSFNEFQRRKTA
jgi:hypothetical protein